jgi:membrane-associated phospholipid phosphatase
LLRIGLIVNNFGPYLQLFSIQILFMRFKKSFAVTCIFSLVYVSALSQNFDINLLKTINENESNFKNNFFNAASQSVIITGIVAPLGVLTAGLIKHDKKLQKDAVWMVGGYILNAAVTQGMKRIIQRDRPFITYSFIIKRDAGGGYSFPSGHTSAAFCTATSLSLLFPKWYVIAPSYLYASAVGYARMYQGVHYPTDVLAGAIVGAGCAWLSFKAEAWMEKKHSAKKAAEPAAL